MHRRFVAPLVVAALKLVVTLVVLWSGFRSISDDDFARVTIAQRFAIAPQFDPSGTSWLPLPFWVYGGAMTAWGTSLLTARITAVLVGAIAALGIWASARWLGLGTPSALVGCVIAVGFPHSAYYGAAMVPDFPSAVLVLMAVASLGNASDRVRAYGATAICLATLCRYETWPIALVVLVDAGVKLLSSPGRPLLLGTILVAPAGAIAWMINGIFRHDDALFFVKRVAAYRQALGANTIPIASRLLKQPLALVTGEPELAIVTLAIPLTIFALHGRNALDGRAFKRPMFAMLGLLAFLVAGDLSDGAPTHHEERTLLAVWLTMALFVGSQLGYLVARIRAPQSFESRRAQLALLIVIGLFGASASLLRPRIAWTEPFVDRTREVLAGQLAAERVPEGKRLALCTRDYGYFAVMAAFGRPLDAVPVSRHDPREREVDPTDSPESFAARLDTLNADFFVVPTRLHHLVGRAEVIHSDPDGFTLARRQ